MIKLYALANRKRKIIHKKYRGNKTMSCKQARDIWGKSYLHLMKSITSVDIYTQAENSSGPTRFMNFSRTSRNTTWGHLRFIRSASQRASQPASQSVSQFAEISRSVADTWWIGFLGEKGRKERLFFRHKFITIVPSPNHYFNTIFTLSLLPYSDNLNMDDKLKNRKLLKKWE